MNFTNFTAVFFIGGMKLKDLWAMEVDTWFSTLHMIIVFYGLSHYVGILRAKERKAQAK